MWQLLHFCGAFRLLPSWSQYVVHTIEWQLELIAFLLLFCITPVILIRYASEARQHRPPWSYIVTLSACFKNSDFYPIQLLNVLMAVSMTGHNLSAKGLGHKWKRVGPWSPRHYEKLWWSCSFLLPTSTHRVGSQVCLFLLDCQVLKISWWCQQLN